MEFEIYRPIEGTGLHSDDLPTFEDSKKDDKSRGFVCSRFR